MNVGTWHASILAKLDMLAQQAVSSHPSHVRCQLPITLPPNNEPEPDLVIVAGQHGAYRDRHPHPADILIVIEVADSSLRHDRDVKQRIYADAGIREYWIVDLSADQIEVYTKPSSGLGRYNQMQTLAAGESASFNLPNGVAASISVSDVLM
jgi:Uma2 family endonuclease